MTPLPMRLIERVKEREHEGYHYEAADGSFELLLRKESGDYTPLFTLESWRVIAEQRADGRVETEATIKLWVDGERYVFTAEGNGPVSALDKALRGALTSVYPELDTIKLVNFKVRILDGAKASDAITRVLLDSSDGEHEWGAIGVSDKRDRGLLGGAGRLTRARHAGRPPPGARGRGARVVVTAENRPGGAGRFPDGPIPLARPVLGEPEEQAVLVGAALGPALAWAARPEFERAFAARVGARFGSAVSSGTAGPHLALRAAGVDDGDEVITTPFSFVASANVAIYERARPVFVDIDPVTLNLDAEAAAAAVNGRTAALLPVHVFGYPADMQRLEETRVADRRGCL